MRKIVLLFLAAMFMAVPVMAVPNVTITCVDDDVSMVTVSYASDGNLIRAFGLDITVTGANITGVVPVDANYRIFPGQIVIADGNVTAYGTCYDPCDLGDGSVTVEMGSLYTEDPCYAGDPNMGYGMKPGSSGTLLKFYVSGDCHYAIDVNTTRGGIVMEDNPGEAPTDNLPCEGDIISGCIVPNVVGMTEAAACVAIDACGLNCGTVTEEVNCTVANGLVLRSDPVGGTEVECDSDVDLVKSLNPPAPDAATNVSPAAGATCVAQAATINWAVGAGTVTQDVYFDTVNPPVTKVLSDTPATTTSYDPPGNMTVYTYYYWQIVEKNECGETTGTVWCFTTGPQAGKPCCQNETVLPKCLGDVKTTPPYVPPPGDASVKLNDSAALVKFVKTLPAPLYKCTTGLDNASCPACYDIDGDGSIKLADVAALVNRVKTFPGPLFKHSCPYPSCANP